MYQHESKIFQAKDTTDLERQISNYLRGLKPEDIVSSTNYQVAQTVEGPLHFSALVVVGRKFGTSVS